MKVIFIDRDGVINKDPGGWTEHSYVTSWKDFYFLSGVKEALRLLTEAGYDIVIVSNQGGVSKGYFSTKALNDITENMLRALEETGAKIKKVYYCPHQDSDNCGCRKPKPGMFRTAEEELGIKAAGSYFIGDGRTDVEAGKAAGLKTVLVLSGKTSLDKIEEWQARPDHIFKGLLEAVRFILDRKG